MDGSSQGSSFSTYSPHLVSLCDGYQQDMLDTLIHWSEVNSGSTNALGLETMRKLIEKYGQFLEADTHNIALPDTEKMLDNGKIKILKNGPALCFSKRPDAPRKILLTGHYDTVFPKHDGFQKVTWLDDNTINGPGVADMKGGILVMLNALRAFETLPEDIKKELGWEIILSPDEETGSHASANLLMERAKTASIGMTYEPAMETGQMAGRRKGSGNFSIAVTGRAAHAGRAFHDGRNAVVHLSKIITKLSKLTDMLPEVTVNVAQITGGTAPNIVPDFAMCRFNVRMKRKKDVKPIMKAIQEIVDKYNGKEGFDVVLHGKINRPPKKITKKTEALMALIKECGSELGLKISYIPTGGCCEGNNLAAAGLPNVDTLGVRGGLIHSNKEYMKVDSLAERAKLSALILLAMATGRFDHMLTEKA